MSRRVAKTKFKTSLKLVACSLCVAFFAEVSLAASFPMTYSGRLTQQTGAPVDGPVDVTVKFWTSANAGNTLGTPIDFANVTLNQGVFILPLELSAAQISAIFGDGTDPVFIEVTAAGKTYPRQHYTYVPLALRVPVDNKTLSFDADGKLGLSLTSLPSANQFLTKDSNGRLSWGSPAVTTLQGQTIAAAAPSSGQVLTFNGGQWAPTTLSTQDIRPTASATFAAVNAATLASTTYVAGTADSSATPGTGMLRAANALGSDVVGANLVLAGGNGTGTGGSGSIQFDTAADDVSGETANTMATRMTITPSGNVGIGTTAPAATLDINGSIKLPGGTQTILRSDTNASGVPGTDGFRIRSDDAYLGGSFDAFIIDKTDFNNPVPDGGIVFANTGSSGTTVAAMTVRGTGNVGIGTTAPNSLLHLSGTSSAPAIVSEAGIFEITTQGSSASELSIGGATAAPYALWMQGKRINSDGTVFPLALNPLGGNVGIGTTSPAQKLDVAGVIRSSSGGIMFPDGSIMTSALPTPSAGYNSTTDLNLAADSGGNGTGNISVSTKGTERVRITNSGNIGIGTTSPTSILDVVGGIAASSGGLNVRHTNLTQGIQVGYNSISASGTSANQDINILPKGTGNVGIGTTAPANKLSVSGSANFTGNVGIGTTTPLSKLDINGAAAIGSYAGTTAAPTDSLIVSGNIGVGTSAPSQPLEVAGVIKSSSGGFMFPDGSVMTTAASAGSNGSTSATDLNLNSDSGAAGSGDIMLSTRGAERMRIANSGNVGIGTNSPADKLFVWSTKESTLTPQTPGLAVGDASLANTGVGGGIAFWGNYTGTTPIAGATIHAMKNNATAGDTGFNLAFNTRPNAGKPTERMRITSTGNVGIGTSVPGASLHVNGGLRAAKGLPVAADNNTNLGYAFSNDGDSGMFYTLVTQTGGGDFVFYNDGAERVRFTNQGNVGIGTTTPSTKLAVAGSGSFTGNVGVGTTLPTQALEVAGTIKSSTGGIMFPDGTVMTSAASPSTGSSSITDLNLGADIGAAGSGVLSFSTAGTERMRVANDGNVGIGTTSPIYQLDVVNPSGPGYVRIQGNQTLGTTRAELILDRTSAARGAGIRMQSTGDSAAQWWAGIPYVGGGSSDLFQIGRHSSSPEILANAYMLITSTGNVGIGTTSPQRRLDLNSGASGGLTEQLVLRNAGASTTAGTGAGLYFALTSASTSRHAAIDALISNAATGATDLTLSTYNGTSVTEKMRIQAGGSVGIGTTTPFNKLSVAGSADFTGNVGIGSNIPTQALDVAGVIRSSTGGIMFPDGSIMTSAATPGTGTSSTGDLTFVADSGETGTGVITFAARGSERMRITNSGSIGFGTAVPLSKVDVAGGMSVGSYAGATAAPTNGLIVSGNVGIGTTSPSQALQVMTNGNNQSAVNLAFGAYGAVGQTDAGTIDKGIVLGNNLMGATGGYATTYTTALYGYRAITLDKNGIYLSTNSGATTAGQIVSLNPTLSVINAGNVGIGTTSPGSKLHVNGNAAIGYSASTAAPTNGLTVSGNVGIGTTTPSQMLEVAGTIRSTSGGIMFPDGTVMTTASGGTSSGTTSVTDLAFASGTGTSSSGVITLATHNLERMRVDYNGNVGIGAAAPVNKLDVAGGVAIGATYAGGTTSPTNGLIVQGNVGIGTTAPVAALQVNGAVYSSVAATNTIGFQSSAANNSTYHLLGTAGSWGIRTDTSSGINFDMYNGGSPLTSLHMNTNGNVGIGTTAPSSLLDVSGAKSAAPSLTGAYIGLAGPTFTDNSTAASGTAANMAFNAIAAPTLASTNTPVTTTNAYTNYIAGAPRKGTNNTVTNAVALGIGAAAVGAQTNSYGLLVNAQTGATNNYTAVFNGGNVGIGSAAPGQKLDVAGAIRSSSGGFVFPDGTIMTTAVTATTAGATSTTDLNLVADSEAVGAGAIVVATNGTERMRVLNSGRVGIGTSIPQSALDVSGGMSLGSYAGVNAAPSNGLIVSGNVGIGTTTPGAALDIQGAAQPQLVVGSTGLAAGRMTFRRYSDGSQQGSIGYASGTESSNFSISGNGGGGFITLHTSGSEKVRISTAGNVGIGTTSPTQRLQVGTSGDGTVALANAWNTFSDIRLKRELTVIPDALDKLLELHGYYYFWKDGSDQTRQVGVVAQEVEKILPELVHTGSDGIKTVDYPKLTAVLIEGTKQLKAEKDNEIAQLKARADAAEAETALLKRALCSKFRDLAVCSY